MRHLSKAETHDPQAYLTERLALAQSRIEQTFLDGGSVLVSVMEILSELIAILDRMTGSMDGDTAGTAVSNMQMTVEELIRLPEMENARQTAFTEMSTLCKSSNGHVDDIKETIRYLKTFAVTVKITGAGISEFSAFAEEIRERIHFGGDEVAKFAQYLDLMDKQLAKARDVSSAIRVDFDATIPEIVRGLKTNAGRIGDQHRDMTAMASKVKSIAQGVQAKIGSTLSSLQIGDITRQRIEHVNTTLALFDEYRHSEEARVLSAAEMDALCDTVFELVRAQIEETAATFQQDCRKIFAGIASFADDAANILSLRDRLVEDADKDGGSALQLLERDIAKACNLAGRVQESMVEANAAVSSVTSTAQDLLQGIEVLRSIKTEIHYMALNSNLRCSKLGDEGRSVNVVSAELRVFADKLETPADAIVGDLRRIEAAIADLAGEKQSSADLRKPLNEALDAVSQAKIQMETGLRDLAEEGQAVFSRISAAVVKLDFESELGNVLEECRQIAGDIAVTSAQDITAFAEKILPLSSRIYKIYTMAQERDVHMHYLPVDLASGQKEPMATASDDDDDLFADALF
ncbi:chemotaxis protein [Agrobacterium tumefaciens]|uniref:chemotaxis protein n=1 Tax=Agrobacterium tumefaciens TaxID=358 RepID=UPI0021D3037F|nr:chemotaxis protein [Agrobacterium tumefaciens]UXS03668.1 chemotaxis protein [Agrobacterium tumefaciens]